ncbi:hypothetical protein BG011_006243 [Mortierella polycephala]|uniref:Uncharacterized protein n=1 Tax=Mortierella polycephala TaxID=41804 RepID=A0A9P6PVB4_9FUNG|nr:hypothetical protein BG011_006243 [Mortierella polycephala]
MNTNINTVSTLPAVIAPQREFMLLNFSPPPIRRHLKRRQCEDAGEVPHCINKKRRILPPPPRRRPGMSTAAGVRAMVEAKAVARMTSVAVRATVVGVTALCPPSAPPRPTTWTSTDTAASARARRADTREIAICRQRYEVRDVEMKDVSAALPMSATVLHHSAPVSTPAAACAQYQKAPKNILATRRIAVPRTQKPKKEDGVEDMEVD